MYVLVFVERNEVEAAVGLFVSACESPHQPSPVFLEVERMEINAFAEIIVWEVKALNCGERWISVEQHVELEHSAAVAVLGFFKHFPGHFGAVKVLGIAAVTFVFTDYKHLVGFV